METRALTSESAGQNRTLDVIESDIKKVKNELANARGSETEVYARIVGYYRSVRNWNKGKKDEFQHRKEFEFSDDAYHITDADKESACCGTQVIPGAQVQSAHSIARYEFYSRKTCPNCPGVRDSLTAYPLTGVLIDVDTPDGFKKASDNGVFAAPTVIMYNEAGEEIIRVHNKKELASVISGTPSAVLERAS